MAVIIILKILSLLGLIISAYYAFVGWLFYGILFIPLGIIGILIFSILLDVLENGKGGVE